jgi:hypothetical protein
MISRTKDPLQVKQQQMRLRQRAQPKLGRPKRRPIDDPKFGNRMTALILLQGGASLEHVAFQLKTTVAAIKQWQGRGMPIIGDWPKRGISLD